VDFFYYPEVGLYHDFDVDRLNDNYYKKVQIGFVYAAYILKIYYALGSSKRIYSNYFSWYFYNLMSAIFYNIVHPLKLQSILLFKDAVNFTKIKNRYLLVKTIV